MFPRCILCARLTEKRTYAQGTHHLAEACDISCEAAHMKGTERGDAVLTQVLSGAEAA